MIGTIKAVYGKKGNGPGAIILVDGTRLPTFDDALISMAEGAKGQLIEYTVKQNGKYTNLDTLTVKGGPVQTSAGENKQYDNAGSGIFNAGALVTAVNGLAAAVRELTSQLGRGGAVAPAPATSGDASVDAAPADPIDAAQARLAAKLGSEDAAEAMIEALKKKHKKSAEKLATAVAELLTAHGVEA